MNLMMQICNTNRVEAIRGMTFFNKYCGTETSMISTRTPKGPTKSPFGSMGRDLNRQFFLNWYDS